MTEDEIKAFWAAHPCGEQFVAGIDDRSYEAFFAAYDRFRYGLESHIPRCLDAIELNGQSVLEIGLGQGADSEQIIRRGGRWTGVDLTPESVERVETRLNLRGLPYDNVVCASALELPFADRSFDVIFSHGVLHHIPEIERAQAELARVLRAEGEAVIMVYAKYSLNYLLSIAILRRLGLLAVCGLDRAGVPVGGIYGDHVDNARHAGIHDYLRLRNFTHRNTDGPSNPYSKVYALSDVRRDFSSFTISRTHKEFMHAPPLPVHGLPLARLAGWHLWVHMRPRVTGSGTVS
jgi:SAM-dependent methyltransferase